MAKKESIIYSQIDFEGAISAKRDNLEIRKNLLNLMKNLEKYKLLRKREFIMKTKLRNDLRGIKKKTNSLLESIPKPEGFKNQKSEKKLKREGDKKHIESKTTKIEQELKDIQRKLEELESK